MSNLLVKVQEQLASFKESINQIVSKNMTSEGVGTSIWIVIAVLVLFSFTFMFLILRDKKRIDGYSAKMKKLHDDSITLMKDSKMNRLNYQQVEKYLLKKGVTYRHKWFKPEYYIICNIVFAIILAASAAVGGYLILVIPGAFVGYNLLDVYIRMTDSSDNKKMMSDIKRAFTTLKMHSQAGVYITDSLSDVYTVIKFPRFKHAVLDMSGELANEASFEDAVDRFNAKFDNNYIDSMAVIIKRANESGEATRAFKDIETQLDEIQSAVVMQEQSSMKMKVLVMQLMIYFGIIACVIYVTFSQIMSSGIQF